MSYTFEVEIVIRNAVGISKRKVNHSARYADIKNWLFEFDGYDNTEIVTRVSVDPVCDCCHQVNKQLSLMSCGIASYPRKHIDNVFQELEKRTYEEALFS